MIKIEGTSDNLPTTKTEQSFEWNHISDKVLSLMAFLIFFIAVISQWSFGFYAADYYDRSALQHQLEISNQQLALEFNCPQKISTTKQ